MVYTSILRRQKKDKSDLKSMVISNKISVRLSQSSRIISASTEIDENSP